jgi:CRP-like cAMP-binding protein
MLNQDAQLGIELTKRMNTLLLRDQSKIRDMIISDKKGALYSILIRLSNSFGEKIGNNIKIKLYLKHHELGQMVGLTRETVTRFLLELKSLDVVSSNKEGLLVIHDLNYLRKMSKCENCRLEICQM